jgi:hypothetical protein
LLLQHFFILIILVNASRPVISLPAACCFLPLLTQKRPGALISTKNMNTLQSGQSEQEVKLASLTQKAIELGLGDFVNQIDGISDVSLKILILDNSVKAAQSLAKKDKEIAEKDKMHQIYKKSSVTGVYGGSNDTFKQPPLRHNDAVVPSTAGHTRKVTIRDVEGNPKKVTLKIPKARIVAEGDGNESMWMNPSDVTIPELLPSGELIPSQLGIKRTKAGGPFQYANEFGVQELCKAMVDDALLTLGLTDSYVKSHLEISIYMMKPDIMLVLEFQGRVIFVIEVKSPGNTKKNKNCSQDNDDDCRSQKESG